MEAVAPIGTVTFLFTDIEGSTRLWQERPVEMEAALADHDDLLRTTIADNNGYIFATGGDGFAAAFASVTDAIEAAAWGQLGLVEHEFLRVRMGIHTGEAQHRGDDYFGSAVNKAARIMAAGHGGQTLLSATTATLVKGHPVKNLGQYRLKDLEGEEVLWQLGTDNFAALRTLDQLPGNLPVQRTTFVGRVDDVKMVAEAVGHERLVTLVGPGGVGKSRLALQTAAELSQDFPDGAWFAPLGSLTEPDLVANAIVGAIELGDRRGETAQDSLRRWFAGHEALLIIDNCEHLVDAVAAAVDDLLDIDSPSRILATGQSPLAVPGELVYAVEPLGGGSGSSDSVVLFADRARSVRSGFDLSDENEAAIIEICDRLDHIPLAIELAASRVRAMSPADIARRLDQRFRLLASNDRGVPGRQRTLEAALRWSYELLDATQQLVLTRLSVFVAPFTLDAAETVVTDERIEAWEVLDALTGLVDKSLVVVRESDDTTRYHLLESVKQFGRAELLAAGDLAPQSQRYADFYTALIEDLAPELMTARDQEVFETFNREWDHVRVALRAAADQPDSPLIDVLYDGLRQVFLTLPRAAEGALWGAVLMELPVADPAARIESLATAAQITSNVDLPAARAMIEAASALREKYAVPERAELAATDSLLSLMLGESERALAQVDRAEKLLDAGLASGSGAHVLSSMLAVNGILGRLDRMEALIDRMTALADRTGSTWIRMAVNSGTSTVIHILDPDGALEFLTGALELSGTRRDATYGHTAMFLGLEQLRQRDMSAAAESLTLAMTIAREQGPTYVGQNVNAVIGAVMRSAPENACLLLGGLAHWRDERGHRGTLRETQAEAMYESRLRDLLGEGFVPVFERGRSLDEAALVQEVFAALDRLAAGVPGAAAQG